MDCKFHQQWWKGKKRNRLLPCKEKDYTAPKIRYLLRNNLCWGKTRLGKIKAFLWLAPPNKHRGSAGLSDLPGEKGIKWAAPPPVPTWEVTEGPGMTEESLGCSWGYLSSAGITQQLNCLFPVWLLGYCRECFLTLPIPLRFHHGNTERFHQLHDVLLWWVILTGFYFPISFSPVVWFGSVTAIYRKQQPVNQHSVRVPLSWKDMRGKFHVGEWKTE